VRATADPGEVGPVDLVLLCVKSYDFERAMENMRPMVGPETAVIPVLNGIEHMTRMRMILGDQPVLGGLALVNGHKGEPGVIHHVTDAGPNQLEFGEWTGGVSRRCRLIQEMWQDAAVAAVAVEDISERMWWKLGVIAGVGVFAVIRGDKKTAWAAETKVLVHKTVAEVLAVAQARQVRLADTLPDEVVNIAEGLPPNYKPSLLVDLEHGNRLEVRATNGAVSRLGMESGVPTPVNDFIYACLKPHMNGGQ
jgi:2-dehydropantoate 2-reductase